MDDAHAAQAVVQAFVQKGHQRGARFGDGEAVQIDLVLNQPVAAAQFAQRVAGEAFAQEIQFIAGLEAGFPRVGIGQAFVEHRAFIAHALRGGGRGLRFGDARAVGAR